MAVPFLSVKLRTPACDFEPLMLAPDLPMLDLPAGQASGQVLRKWLGDLVAEPCWNSEGVAYFLPADDATTSAAARPQCIVPRDLRSGPIRAQYLKLWASLSRVQPEAGEAALLAAVCKSFESPDRADRVDRLGDCLFKYRDAHKQWHLVWAWGYRRKADRAGRAMLCRRCSLLSVRPTRGVFRCPACGWRPLSRLLAAAALAALLLGIGLGTWATMPSGTVQPTRVQPEMVKHAVAPSPSPRSLLVEVAPGVSKPTSLHSRGAHKTIAKITQPIRSEIDVPPLTPVHTAAVIQPVAPPRPGPVKVNPVKVHPVKVYPVAVASTATHTRTVAAHRLPAAIMQSVSGQLPPGVRVDPDGKVFLGYRSVTPTFDVTTQFAPSGNQPSRYIYGSHVYAESRDVLHGGEPALQQWQHYVMSDELSDGPGNTGDSGHGVSLVLFDRGTDAEISNSTTPGGDSWAETGSPVHLVETSASGNSGGRPTPRFDLPIDSPMPFYPTVPRCHGKHRRGGFASSMQQTDPALFRRFTPSPREPTLDAKLTVVALQYFGHSSPDEVLADLQAARVKAEGQANTQQSNDAHHAILQLCDSEIALWRDVVGSNSTADAATAAYKAGDTQRADELCQDYQAQVAAYTNRPEWSLFETRSQQVAALADKLSSHAAVTR